VCGGGSGEMFLEELRSNGYIISCGVLNESDSDAVCCNSLGIEFIEERPYSPISEGKKEDNLALMKSCEAIVLTDVPFGTGNMANLSSIWQICEESDLPVYIVAAEGRDFVGGAADDIIDKLINLKGAMSCSRQELLALIKSGRI
jgi:iron complex transport system ATP-binding protein